MVLIIDKPAHYTDLGVREDAIPLWRSDFVRGGVATVTSKLSGAISRLIGDHIGFIANKRMFVDNSCVK